MTDATTSSLADTRRRFREQMAIHPKWAYFDHAAVSPMPRPTRAAIEAWMDEAGGDGGPAWMNWARGVEQTRRSCAQLLGATPEEIAFTPHTTAGISLVAQGLSWQSGDNVVTLEDEFPANVYPWLSLGDLGVETRFVPTDHGRVDLDDVRARCDERTRVVSVSWVAFLSGHRRDLVALGDLAREIGAWFVVDAIQGVGALPFDVAATPADVVAVNGQKWQMGPEGGAYAYVRRERLDDLRVAGLGWNSMDDPFNFDRLEIRLRDTAARFEAGTRNMSGLIGLGASQAMLLELGIENIAAAILDTTDEACRRLGELGAEVLSRRAGDERSGIVQFQLPGADSDAVRSHCMKQGVALACRSGTLRISPHGYTNSEDLDRLMDALGSF